MQCLFRAKSVCIYKSKPLSRLNICELEKTVKVISLRFWGAYSLCVTLKCHELAPSSGRGIDDGLWWLEGPAEEELFCCDIKIKSALFVPQHIITKLSQRDLIVPTEGNKGESSAAGTRIIRCIIVPYSVMTVIQKHWMQIQLNVVIYGTLNYYVLLCSYRSTILTWTGVCSYQLSREYI